MLTHPPEMKHMQQDWNFHEIQSSRYVIVPEHDQAFAQFQGRLLQKVSFPVATENFLQKLCVDLRRILLDELV